MLKVTSCGKLSGSEKGHTPIITAISLDRGNDHGYHLNR